MMYAPPRFWGSRCRQAALLYHIRHRLSDSHFWGMLGARAHVAGTAPAARVS
jgi:hypothetical protein